MSGGHSPSGHHEPSRQLSGFLFCCRALGEHPEIQRRSALFVPLLFVFLADPNKSEAQNPWKRQTWPRGCSWPRPAPAAGWGGDKHKVRTFQQAPERKRQKPFKNPLQGSPAWLAPLANGVGYLSSAGRHTQSWGGAGAAPSSLLSWVLQAITRKITSARV